LIKLKRVYSPASLDDGYRVLVERLWPRGVTKERARVDLWLKEVAPSPELRKWFGHDPARWDEFRRRYRTELQQKSGLLDLLKQRIVRGPVTFVYAARDEEHNGAVVLKEFLDEKN